VIVSVSVVSFVGLFDGPLCWVAFVGLFYGSLLWVFFMGLFCRSLWNFIGLSQRDSQ